MVGLKSNSRLDSPNLANHERYLLGIEYKISKTLLEHLVGCIFLPRKVQRMWSVEHWPEQDYSILYDISIINVELNKKSVVAISKTENDILNCFQNYGKLIRFISYCRRWVTRKSHHSNVLSSEELKDAEFKIYV
ncbi:unnamed protein product [Lepeophtheirus salmonis]|uniref:(salmon louse) hypothetical protein n=1 Tax=Lepeophtheirus salmonis TaxID=72036 RepID=A0A7R8CU56_LEPSM|nr:unnamed protein product [Lepeophtheirus salmonis]CAF2932349.1 unnamed protein product [Lepeophtheirus salmonis]